MPINSKKLVPNPIHSDSTFNYISKAIKILDKPIKKTVLVLRLRYKGTLSLREKTESVFLLFLLIVLIDIHGNFVKNLSTF